MATKKITTGPFELTVTDRANPAKPYSEYDRTFYSTLGPSLYDIQLVNTQTGAVLGSWKDAGAYSFNRDGWLVVVEGKQPFLDYWLDYDLGQKGFADKNFTVSVFSPNDKVIDKFDSASVKLGASNGDFALFDEIKVTQDKNALPELHYLQKVYDPTYGWTWDDTGLKAANANLVTMTYNLKSIFTEGRDVIDFNALSAEQKARLKTGVRYDAFDGNDDVKLPNSANASTTGDIDMGGWVWNRSFEFSAGAGDDNVQSSNGADLVDLGDGNDIWTGTYGDDVVKGGKGNDIFDYKRLTATGNRPFSEVHLDGGAEDLDKPIGGDVLLLKGASSDYIIVPNLLIDAGTRYADQELLIQSARNFDQKAGEVPQIRYIVKNIEKIGFETGPTNVVKLLKDSFTAEMAKLAKEVYGPLPTLGHKAEYLYSESNVSETENAPLSKIIAWEAVKRGWHPVSSLELNLPPAYLGAATEAPKTFEAPGVSPTLQFSMYMGHYQAKDPKDRILFSKALGDVPEANAMVLTGIVDGKKTLVIAFRGTDQPSDWDDYVNFANHYAKYKPLLDKLPYYMEQNGITQVFATGHSLGGGMVEYFMADSRFTKYNPKAVTFGSPGSDAQLSIDDNRILNFVHTDDIVAKVPDVQGPIETSVIAGAIVTGSLGGVVGAAVATTLTTALANAFQNKDRHGVDVLLNSAVVDSLKPDVDFFEHSMSLYVQDMVQLQQLAKAENGQSLYGQSVYGGYWKNEFGGYKGSSGVQIALPGPTGTEIGLSYKDKIIVKSNDTFVLGGLPSNFIVIRADQEVPAFIRIIDGGPGTDTIYLSGKVDDYFLQSNGYGGYDLMKLMPHGTPDTPIASLVSIEKFSFGASGTLGLSFADFLKRGVPVQGGQHAAAAPDSGKAEALMAGMDPLAREDLIFAADQMIAANPDMAAAAGIDPFAALASLLAPKPSAYVTDGTRGFTGLFKAADLNGGTLVGSGGKDILDLSGIDLTDFSLETANGRSTLMLNGKTTVLDGIERIVFNEGVLALDDGGMAGYAYRIYQAAFARTPDQPGLSYWFDQLDRGTGVKVVADSFLLSEEFQKLYGTAPTSEQYIDLLYANVLNRKADKDGYDYWNDYLAKGGTRSEILIYFAESKENVENLKADLASGIWFST